MSNRYHYPINGKLSAPTPPKDKRETGSVSYTERTRAWKTDIGPVGPKRNTVGFPEVKQSAKQHMADDAGLLRARAMPAGGGLPPEMIQPVPSPMPGRGLGRGGGRGRGRARTMLGKY
jgi:hypothetical protein